MQARGEHNPRDFDKYICRLPIPLYDPISVSMITIESDTYQITVEDGITITAPRTTSDIKRHKASHYADRGERDGRP